MGILVKLFYILAISFAESNFILNGKIVTEKEYLEAKSLHLVNSDAFYEINEEDLARNWASDHHHMKKIILLK